MPLTTNAPIGTDIMRAVGSLCERDVVIIPTETDYVLACNALDMKAVEKLRSLHGDVANAKVELYVSSFDKFEKYVKVVPEAMAKLARRFLPGPMTFLLPRKHMIADWVTTGQEKVALRVPSHPLTRSLLSKLYFPLAVMHIPLQQSTTGGGGSDVLESLGDRIGYVLDGGATAVGAGSTWLEMGEGCILVHRTGAVSREMIEKVSGLPTFQYLAPLTPDLVASRFSFSKPA